MGGTPTDHAPGPGAPQSADDKVSAAFALLASAFDDTRLDSEILDKEALLQQISATQHVLNTAFAVQAARLAEAAAREDVRFPDHNAPSGFREHEVTHPIGTHQDEFIGCEIGPLLGWTSGQAIGRVSEAADYITRTPRLFARVGTGEIEPAKLATIHRAIGRTTRGLDHDGDPVATDLARRVETALLGDVSPEDDTAEGVAIIQANVDLIASQSTGRLQRRTERILRFLDPVAAGQAAKRRRRDRIGVFAHPDEEPGLTHLHAILDSPTSAKLMAVIDQLARDLHDDTTTDKTLAECRADALADLVMGNATVATKLVIQVPIHVGGDGDREADRPHSTDPAAAGAGRAAGGGKGSAFWPAAEAGDSGEAAAEATPGGYCSRGGLGGWPGAFTHPITGLTVLRCGFPPGTAAGDGAGAPTTSSTGVRVKSQHEVDAEFNELLKTLFPPDPDDYPPEVFDEYYEPTDQGTLDDEPPEWFRPEQPGPGRQPGPSGPSGRSGASRPSRSSAACLGDGLVPGVGIIPAAVIEAMSRSFGMTITRALVDAATGVTVETCEMQYRPSPRLADFIRARDKHCRFPNCDRPARWCDIDHVTAWPGGPTAAWDLQLLCRHHHRTKQEQRWSVRMTPDGVCTWTSPSGRTYITYPGE